jgi:hypothetical protein
LFLSEAFPDAATGHYPMPLWDMVGKA